jgi:hypothetical protein
MKKKSDDKTTTEEPQEKNPVESSGESLTESTLTLGKAAWDAYRESVGKVSLNKQPLPHWDELLTDPSKETVVKGWVAAALAVKKELGKVNSES